MGWIEDVLSKCNRHRWPVVFEPHAIMRQGERGIEPRYMVDAVRKGRVIEHKCEYPRKLCLEYYEGKSRMTYGVYIVVEQSFFRVKTGWTKRGRS